MFHDGRLGYEGNKGVQQLYFESWRLENSNQSFFSLFLFQLCSIETLFYCFLLETLRLWAVAYPAGARGSGNHVANRSPGSRLGIPFVQSDGKVSCFGHESL